MPPVRAVGRTTTNRRQVKIPSKSALPGCSFLRTGKALTLPPKEEPDMALLEEMARSLASYGTEAVGPPGPPQKG